MILYLDSSALVKRYIAESGSVAVDALVRQAEVVATGVLTRAEVPAAVAKAVRLNWLGRTDAERILRVFRSEWRDLVVVQATEALMALADTLAWEHGLRAYDAVHLASALTWQDALGSMVTVATYDRQLWQAAPKAALVAWPEKLK